MNTAQLGKVNVATSKRIGVKHNLVRALEPIPYINSKVLIAGLVGAEETLRTKNPNGLTPSQVEVFASAYSEVIEGIIDTIREKQGPVVCIYVSSDELKRLQEMADKQKQEGKE